MKIPQVFTLIPSDRLYADGSYVCAKAEVIE